jgi:hypothetical protein
MMVILKAVIVNRQCFQQLKQLLPMLVLVPFIILKFLPLNYLPFPPQGLCPRPQRPLLAVHVPFSSSPPARAPSLKTIPHMMQNMFPPPRWRLLVECHVHAPLVPRMSLRKMRKPPATGTTTCACIALTEELCSCVRLKAAETFRMSSALV